MEEVDEQEALHQAHMQAFDRVVSEMRILKEKKQRDYNSKRQAWASLGLKGLFADINRKFWRLYNLVWESQKPQVDNESVRDSYLDIANYAIMSIIYIDEQARKGEANNGV